MHINHKPGDKMMVDWNGTRMYVYDRYTGEAIPAYLFEATLPFSMYSYVQACPSMKINDWAIAISRLTVILAELQGF